MTQAALRYDPSMEVVAPDEAETNRALVDTMRSINQKTYDDSGHANRSVHAKAHALLKGEMVVRGGLPPELAQGIFAAPRTYPVALRFSTNPGDILDDPLSAPRGLALKVVGVDGERLPGSEGLATQDFVMIDAPVFSAPDAKTFLKSLKPLAATTDRAEGAKKVLSAVARVTEKALEAVGGESATLIQLGGHPQTHPAGGTYYSQVPLLHGSYVAKVSVAPSSPELTALAGQTVDLRGDPDGLRAALKDLFARHGGQWDVRVQLLTNRDSMPVEDASVPWPEDESPYVSVATITVPAQSSYDEARHQALDEGLAFSPWDGIAAHRPLGSVMRSRKAAYEMSAGFRAEANGCPIRHPRGAADL